MTAPGTDVDATGDPDPGAGAEWDLRRDVVVTAAVGLVGLVLCILVYGFTSRHALATPLGYGDNLFYAGFVKTMKLSGWYSPAMDLGAPYHQDLLDYPMADNHLHLALLALMARLPVGPFTVLNLYVILAFAAVAAVTYVCFRSVGIERVPAAVAAVLFDFLPYHFAQAHSHAFLQAYWSIPLLLPLLRWLLWGPFEGRRRALWLVLVGVIVAVLGASGVYYVAFLLVVLAAAAVLGSFRAGGYGPVVRYGLLAGALMAVVVVNFLPNILMHRREGVNHELAQRRAAEAEAFGLRPSLLVLPDPGHRVGALADLGQRANEVTEPSEGPVALGLLAGGGFLVAAGSTLAWALRTGRRPVLPAMAGVLTIVAVVVAAKGSFSFLFAVLGTRQLRTWSRMSIVIGLLSLTLLAWYAPRLRQLVGRRCFAPVLVGVAVLALVDQVPGTTAPDRSAIAAQIGSDQAFTTEMESALPEGSMVFQLPVVRFPEHPPPGRIGDYEELRSYVAGSGALRYSYGGLKGRESQWQDRWAGESTTVLARAAAAAGFSAVMVHRGGYWDDAAALEGDLRSSLGPPAGVSPDGTLSWFDLRPLRDAVGRELGAELEAVRRAVVAPPFLRWEGTEDPWANVFPVVRALTPESGAVVESPAPRRVTLRGTLTVPTRLKAVVFVGGRTVADVEAGERQLDVPISLTAESTRLEVRLLDAGTGKVADRKARLITRGFGLVDAAADVLVGP